MDSVSRWQTKPFSGWNLNFQAARASVPATPDAAPFDQPDAL